MKYRIFKNDNAIYVISTYAGKTVRGTSKCNTDLDQYDETKGTVLAKARCDAKVATLRRKRSEKKYDEAVKNLKLAQDKLTKMMAYKTESAREEKEALDLLADLEKQY